MTLKHLGVLLLAGGMTATLSAAESKPRPPQPGEERPDDVICTYEQSVGSHLKRRVCATRQAREDAQKADQETMERLRRGGRGRAGPEPSGPGG